MPLMRHTQTIDSETELPILPLKDLTLLIREVVEGTFSRVRVRAEISGLKRHSSGHTYFSLKDDESVLDAVCWRGTPQALLEDGLEIIATGRITVYGARSKYQMIVESFEPAGEGALLKLLLERKNRLAAEGLFDASRKKPLPRLPQCGF
jgi:exodeoxyribonuclease VII large subunit